MSKVPSLDGVTGKVEELKKTATDKVDTTKSVASGIHAPDASNLKDTVTGKVDAAKSTASEVHAPDAPHHDQISPTGVGSGVEGLFSHSEG